MHKEGNERAGDGSSGKGEVLGDIAYLYLIFRNRTKGLIKR